MKTHWTVTAIHTALLERDDGRLLTFTIAWDDTKQKHVAVALEGGAAKKDDYGAVLDDHAHAHLGFFDEEKDAKKACDDYGKTWLSGTNGEKCDCDEINIDDASNYGPNP